MTALPDINTVGVLGNTKESFLQTLSGKMISVQNPDPRQIDFNDIVEALVKQCRFNGHCCRFYSVGEHTVRGVHLSKKLYPNNTKLAKSFFLHDFTEAYVGDVIRPVKRHLPEFRHIEKGFHEAICKAFELPPEDFDDAGVYEIDNLMVTLEKRDLLPSQIEWPGLPDISKLNLPSVKKKVSEKHVRRELLHLKNTLFGESCGLQKIS